ncbi:MAG: hypothetical protein D4S02_00300 [Rhodocyclaceae bacterium]|nr:MAG: hypothetical protein D4S02_00300 [Rhodocyclaceae bacterium]
MHKTLIASTVAAALLLPTTVLAQTATPPPAAEPAPAAAPASPFTGNFTLASEYLYRGIAQTRGKAAVQGGFDYAHPNGFYIGTWGSNISWLVDAGASGASLELDVYGGYKGAINDDLGYDIGVLTYNYPGSYPKGFTNPDTTEIYGAITWKWLTAKYSHTTTNLFGALTPKGGKTTGSGYLDLTATFDLGDGLGVTAHVGHQAVKDFSAASYTDWKLGVTKDVGVGVIGAAVLSTDAKGNCAKGEFYCFASPAGGYESGKSRLLLTFGKTF